MAEPYALQYSESARASRKELPPGTMTALFDILDTLAADPDAFPGRVRAISRDGSTRLYSHPSPPLQITYEIDTVRRVLYLQHFVAPRVPATRPVFISYSHKDTKWLEKLKLFLRPLEEKELISLWDDSSILPGSDWLDDIRKALESARVAVFLVTQNFISSPFIRNTELPALLDAAKNRGCLIFWIAVSTTTPLDGTPFERIQGALPPNAPLDLMTEGEQNKALADIYARLKTAVSAE